MAAPAPQKLFDEADVLILVGLALGMSQERAGKWVLTPQFPDGVSDRTVRNRIQSYEVTADRLIGRIASEFRQKQADFEAITKERYKEKLAELRSKAVKVKEAALDHAILNSGDVDALSLGARVADSIEERDLGKPSQVHKVEGSATINHVFFNPQPVRLLAAQEVDMINSNRLLDALPADAIEAEVVEA